MARQIFVFALLALFVVFVSSATNQSMIEDRLNNSDPNKQNAAKVEPKVDLLEYEEPGEDENPLNFVTNILYQIFGITVKNLLVKVIRGITAFTALIIVGLSAVSYTI